MKKLNGSKVGAVALGLGIIAGTAFGAFAIPNVEYVDVPYVVEKEVVKVVETEKIVKEESIKIVNNTIEVEDTELAQALCDRLLFEDLEVCDKEVSAEDEAIKLAFSVVDTKDFFDKLEDKNIVEDEDEVSVIKVYSDFEDITIVKSDYDEEIYKFKFDVKVEDTEEDEKKKVQVSVSIEDGDVEFSVKEL